ncbi:uncharacterized protein N7473_003795 [Penicillium subrubescens]|uniref:uncharacterized protein n=1 Tax=Penicillium subrubescens TaxID=1316194 RepID=UPI002545A414|nr:uncharacterized protein N7473_003795 [Penicillium subrubescens]KAJ5906879.1 hypothetical protein N7473_003795 [Penicillium subrubescens]
MDIVRQATSRGIGARTSTYWPGDPEFTNTADYTNIGEPLAIPEAHAGETDRPPAEWAHFIWLAPFSVARQAQRLKGKLHELLKNEPVRELTCRKRYFGSGRHQDELIGNSLSNVESAAVFCQGVVQSDDKQCESCLGALGPWAKCVQLESGEGHLAACANCIWNGKHERCSLWRNAQTGSTPERQNQGHQRNRPSISKKMASDAWAEAKRTVNRAKGLSAKIAQALANEQFEVASALLEEQEQWFEDFKCPEGILDLVHPAQPNSPQRPGAD